MFLHSFCSPSTIVASVLPSKAVLSFSHSAPGLTSLVSFKFDKVGVQIELRCCRRAFPMFPHIMESEVRFVLTGFIFGSDSAVERHVTPIRHFFS